MLAVTGSIAAFKGAKLASDLVTSGFHVRVVLSAGGSHFVAPLTFEALTGNPVATEIWDEQPGTSRIGHLELARWANVLLVAPASASTIARLALGLADDMLGSIALATRAPLVIAPAMETEMWTHSTTQSHVQALLTRGARLIGPESGHLASGAEGVGRMSEPSDILQVVQSVFAPAGDLSGIRVLVTAGPTFEPIDPVRFIGNRSSGKMGYAVAEEARARGAEVVLVTGPTALAAPEGVQTTHVETTEQMYDAVLEQTSNQDVVVMAAAISDFRPEVLAPHKIKRRDGVALTLTPTPDVAAAVARAAPNALHVGFALESENLIEAAREKLARKGQDLVVANLISEDHNPFGADSNRVALVSAASVREYPSLPKREVARLLWDEIVSLLRTRGSVTDRQAQ